MVKKLTLILIAPLLAFALAGCSSDKSAATVQPSVTTTSLPSIYAAQISPANGPPGTEVTIVGTNWPPGLPITVTSLNSDANSKPYAQVNATADGTFKSTFRLEKGPNGEDLKPGRLDLSVVSLKGATTVSFQVEAPRPVPQPGAGG
jgi:IPT/TIG domain-containing protein